MLVLLPPSEGKASSPRRGRPLDLDSLSMPELTPTRRRLLSTLVTLCRTDPEAARVTLGLPPGLAEEISRNAGLHDARVLPVASLYTGVLYDSLDLASLDPAARRRAARSLLVFSGLWGALRINDRVPAYRLSGDASLPALGTLTALWKQPLTDAMAAILATPAGRGLVLDLRSSTYANLWRPDPATAKRTVTVRVLQERIPGDRDSRMVVSHFNKATKGRLVRALLDSGADPRTPAKFVQVVRDLGYQGEEGAPPRPGKPHTVDVIVTEV